MTISEQNYATLWHELLLRHTVFPKDIQEAVMQLYKFVRIPDEIVDTISSDNLHTHYQHARKELTDMHRDIRNTLTTDNTNHPTRGEITKLVNQYSIHPSYIDDFFAAMLQDCDRHRYHTYEQLQGYMYGSAEVVGLMMCDILQAPEYARPQARLLGEAMQYTNFLRDIYEDYSQYGRIYMPTDRLQKYGLTHDNIIQFCQTKKINKAWKDFMQEQITHCTQLYAQANQGIASLPKQTQLPVVLASKLYQGILDKIVSVDYNIFAHSARTDKRQKAKIVGHQIIQHYHKRCPLKKATLNFKP